jgi:tRNA/tmRNA/rRNA uracil-C5-methylase (TrmA/RlmC/RlmD family)
MGQQRLQELTEEYGQGRIIFIEVDVRSYQQLEGDRNVLWRDEQRHHKYNYNVNLKIFDTNSSLTPKLLITRYNV